MSDKREIALQCDYGTSIQELTAVVQRAARSVRISGKVGKSALQPSIAKELADRGYDVDVEDSRGLLPPSMPVWRSKDDWGVVPTKGRRRIDIVVYSGGQALALIETESDLNDLRVVGVTRRSGHYDVASIARRADGTYFDSYNSLERMACAAFYWNVKQQTGQYPSPVQAVEMLEAIHSDTSDLHNSNGLGIVLVSGTCRPQDRKILEPRLKSLRAELICARQTI